MAVYFKRLGSIKLWKIIINNTQKVRNLITYIEGINFFRS